MPRSSLLCLTLLVSGILCRHSWAVTLDYYTISTTPWPSPPACITPDSAPPYFLTTDLQAHLWFAVFDGQTGDAARYQLYRPDGSLYLSGSWTALSSPGYWCFQSPLTIDRGTPGSTPGTWTYVVYWNNALLFTLPFSIQIPKRAL